MTQEMKGLLLEDRWAPVTAEMGFLELGAEQAAQAFATWQRGLPISRGNTIEVLPVSGTLEQVLSSLLPLTSGETQRDLFIPTRSAWTAYVENGWTGTDAASAMSVMARSSRGRSSTMCAPFMPRMMEDAGSSVTPVSRSTLSRWSSTRRAR